MTESLKNIQLIQKKAMKGEKTQRTDGTSREY